MLTEKLECMVLRWAISVRTRGCCRRIIFQSLIKDNHLREIHFDDTVKNMEKYRGQIQEEYDLVITNGDAIAVVEVKYKVHKNDLDKLDRKMKHFKQLFLIYRTFKQYDTIAAFHINDDAEGALRYGYFVL
ncbi:MAG: hypothetical protein Q7U54_00005 [Bacteroidales bacterium]|nr:hypothetical protein [Bacteroidales bacterium]